MTHRTGGSAQPYLHLWHHQEQTAAIFCVLVHTHCHYRWHRSAHLLPAPAPLVQGATEHMLLGLRHILLLHHSQRDSGMPTMCTVTSWPLRAQVQRTSGTVIADSHAITCTVTSWPVGTQVQRTCGTIIAELV
eukprot:1143632-Pelagomonas_calceolata.AAC.6